MAKPGIRIFSYQPNPRIFKATIAGRLCGVEVELRGAKAAELATWLWDFDARPLDDAGRQAHAASARTARTGFAGTLYKTDAFLAAHPYGTVPAGFSRDGDIGIFESNSIMRAVARQDVNDSAIYGDSPCGAARIDSFLDVSLIFARDSQIYLLALMQGKMTAAIHANTSAALDHWLAGIERALSGRTDYIAGPSLSLADICFVCELVLLANEQASIDQLNDLGLARLAGERLGQTFPRALAHYEKLCGDRAFAPDIAPYLDKLALAAKKRNA